MKRTKDHRLGAFRALVATAFIVSSAAGLSVSCVMAEDNFSPVYIPEEFGPIIEGDVYSYRINYDDTITIAKYKGNEDVIKVPSEIGRNKVAIIGSRAFSGVEADSVIIPEEIDIIENGAFEYCKIRESLELPENISIHGDAFAYATLPDRITLPSGAITGEEAFGYCKNLELLMVEPNVIVGRRTFDYSEDLKYVVFAEGSAADDRAFEYGDSLERAYLCGDVEITGDPFSYCDKLEIIYAAAEEYEQIPEKLKEGSDSGKTATPKELYDIIYDIIT